MNYEEMSDFEINKRILELYFTGSESPTFSKKFKVPDEHCLGSALVVTFSDCSKMDVDFCKRPSDAWPIIVDNEISILRDVSTSNVWEAIPKMWHTTHGPESRLSGKPYFIHENPLRAAMIAYLMMKGE